MEFHEIAFMVLDKLSDSSRCPYELLHSIYKRQKNRTCTK